MTIFSDNLNCIHIIMQAIIIRGVCMSTIAVLLRALQMNHILILSFNPFIISSRLTYLTFIMCVIIKL